MQKSEPTEKSRPVTDEELAAQQYLFEAAYNDIKGGQSRKDVIQKLAKDLADIGYVKTRIARAIVKKLTHDPLKITTDDYVRRVLSEEYKDYSKPTATKTKKEKKDTKLEIEKTKQEDGKEITTVILKVPKKVADTKKTQTKKKVVPSDKIQVDDLAGEAEVELPGIKSSPNLEAKVRVLEDELIKEKQDKDDIYKEMNTKINELIREVEELGRPYQQRQYIQVSLGQETAIVAYFGVAMPKTKSMGVVKKSAIPLATLDEKKQDMSEWEKNLKPGRVSVDVNIDDSKPTETKSKSPESA